MEVKWEAYILCKMVLDLMLQKKHFDFYNEIGFSYSPGLATHEQILIQLRMPGRFSKRDFGNNSGTLGKDLIQKLSGSKQHRRNGSKFHRRC